MTPPKNQTSFIIPVLGPAPPIIKYPGPETVKQEETEENGYSNNIPSDNAIVISDPDDHIKKEALSVTEEEDELSESEEATRDTLYHNMSVMTKCEERNEHQSPQELESIDLQDDLSSETSSIQLDTNDAVDQGQIETSPTDEEETEYGHYPTDMIVSSPEPAGSNKNDFFVKIRKDEYLKLVQIQQMATTIVERVPMDSQDMVEDVEESIVKIEADQQELETDWTQFKEETDSFDVSTQQQSQLVTIDPNNQDGGDLLTKFKGMRLNTEKLMNILTRKERMNFIDKIMDVCEALVQIDLQAIDADYSLSES